MQLLRDARRVAFAAGVWALAASASAIPIAGTTTGIFINPVGPVGMITSGVGTSVFTWGDGTPFGSAPNLLSFTGLGFSGTTSTPFTFGTLDYFNGTIALGTEATGVSLRPTLTFITPAGVQSFTFPLDLINTPNVPGDDDASADIVHLVNSVPSEFFVSGGQAYTLEFLGFFSGGSLVDEFHVREGERATANLVGVVTPIPEPGTVVLFGTGLLATRRLRRRRGAQAEPRS